MWGNQQHPDTFIYFLNLVILSPPILCASAVKAKHAYFLSLLSLQMLQIRRIAGHKYHTVHPRTPKVLMNTGKDLCNHYISALFLEMTPVNYHLAEESIVLIWSLHGPTVDYIKHMKKLPRNPGMEWCFFVLHKNAVCSCIHVYKYVKWFGLPVSEGRALYVADLLTSEVVHLSCQL